MPQITLEYSGNCAPEISTTEIFKSVHRILQQTGGIKLENCKSRAYRADDYFIADGNAKNAFCHLQIRFVEGRDESIRKLIGEQCLATLQQSFAADIAKLDLQITVEVMDITLTNYHKYPEGTLTKQ